MVVVQATRRARHRRDVGPRPDGTIQPEFVDRLREVGAWLRANGESIYGTRQGPVPPRDWGVTTRKGNKVYVHLLKLDDDVLALPKLPGKIAKASLLGGGKVEYVENNLGVMLKVDAAARDSIDTVAVLEMKN